MRLTLDNNIQLTIEIQIAMKSKTKLPSNKSTEKIPPPPPRPKPQFSTDFIDRDKYKLSQTEMIQKKAALQSKHRQQAIEQLQQRRKKLEMGIIDDDTRKVYETALTSKKIDLNPNIRRNLSQMIQYEKQKQKELDKDRKGGQEQYDNQWYPNCHGDGNVPQRQCSDPSQEYEKQLKDAQAFIKKFQRAKKMDKIERAVNLLTQPQGKPTSSMTKPSPKKMQAMKSKEKLLQKRPIFQNEGITNNILRNSVTSMDTSTNEQILSNIQDTIRFMEERLFSAGRIDKLKKQHKTKQSVLSSQSSRPQPIKTNNSYSDLPYKANQSLSNHCIAIQHTSYPYPDPTNPPFYQQTLQISHLKVKQDLSDDDNDCLDTIRRMKEMIDIKQSTYEQPHLKKNMKQNINFGNRNINRLQQFSTVQKQSPHYAESDAEIDFSLTMNNSQSLQHSQREKYEFKHEHSARFGGIGKEDEYDDEYERIKKSLFEEVNRLQINSINESSQPSINAKTHEKQCEMIDQSSIPNLRPMPTPSPSTFKKQKKGNAQLQRLKNQINGTKSIVDSINIETLPATSKHEVIGMDFRGSFNIKKNIVQL